MIGADLDALVRRARHYLDSITTDVEPELTTLLYRYMCILISSNIDKALHLIFAEFARTRGSPELAQFVSRKYVRGTNYNTQRIIAALSLFDAGWGHAFDAQVLATDLKEKIDAIYGIRNSIAHGELVNVSRANLDGYFEAHKRVTAIIKTIVLG